MVVQCTPDRLLTSLRVSFAEDITTTHLIPFPNKDDKAALYYTRRDLKIFKLTHQLRTQRKIVILMKVIANTDALNKRKEENAKALQLQTMETFYNTAGSAPVEELTWTRTRCTKSIKTESVNNAARPDLEWTWKRTCCTKTKACDAKSAPVMLHRTRSSQLNGDQLGMANTKPQEENVQAMESLKITSFYIGAPRATQEEWTCSGFNDCGATTKLPKNCGFQLKGDFFGVANKNPQEEIVQAMKFQKIKSFYIGAPRATEEEWTC